MFLWICALLVGSLLVTTHAQEVDLSVDEFIEKINSLQDSWEAGINPQSHFPSEHLKTLTGVHPEAHRFPLPLKSSDSQEIELPDEFDARTVWPNCPSIREIRDQSNCKSCWAFGAVEAMSDRFCIHSDGKRHFEFSAEDLLSCCEVCGLGCGLGGYPPQAWTYWVEKGIVSGGNYGSGQGCQPYAIAPYNTSSQKLPPSCANKIAPTPACVRKCQSSYNVSYEEDLHYGKEVYSIENDEKKIRMEIMKNGPVEADFTVYEDFIHYKTGVYWHVTGGSCGGHAIRIIGWGKQDDKPFWLIANSWNSTWGENGYFKMLRGENECGIETSINAGIPKYTDLV